VKILYIGHYKEFGGWGQAAADYILALDKAGVDVVCRNVTLTVDMNDVNPRILELEKKSSQGCDFCVQHVLPHHLVKTDKFKKNVAFLASESTSIKHLAWFEHLKLVDEVWVPNNELKQSLEKDNLGVPISVVPHTIDIAKYKKDFRCPEIKQIENTFKFYYIGDVNARKNISSIVRCFHSEFSLDEDVSLVLKLSKFGKSSKELSKEIDAWLQQVKKSLRIYKNVLDYKREVLITEKIIQEQLYGLHKYCDCFICPSHGEAWSIPSFEAMLFGNTPICSNFGGPKEFIDKSNWRTGHLINGVYSCCDCQDAAFPDMFTAKEFWFQPCEMQIRNQMRTCYNSWKKDKISYKSRNQAAGFKQAEKFSYQNVAKIMKEALNA
jgi:hypothetical protein